jgi:hypothetical protein
MSEGEISEPVMDGAQDASRKDRIDGILDQVAADLIADPEEDGHAMLRQRLADAQLSASDSEVAALDSEVRSRTERMR